MTEEEVRYIVGRAPSETLRELSGKVEGLWSNAPRGDLQDSVLRELSEEIRFFADRADPA